MEQVPRGTAVGPAGLTGFILRLYCGDSFCGDMTSVLEITNPGLQHGLAGFQRVRMWELIH